MLVNPCCVSNKQFIVNVQTQASVVLDALIPSDAHIILLDYPHHPNVGDSLIWLGEIAYLNNRGLKPSYVCDYQNYNVTTIKKIHRKIVLSCCMAGVTLVTYGCTYISLNCKF